MLPPVRGLMGFLGTYWPRSEPSKTFLSPSSHDELPRRRLQPGLAACYPVSSPLSAHINISVYSSVPIGPATDTVPNGGSVRVGADERL